jgi:hypothetical protein
MLPIGELLEDRLTVIADGCDLDATCFEPLFRVLQLNQLRFAEGSPIGRTEEKQNRSFRPLQCLDGLVMAKLVLHGKGWRFLSNLQSNRG